MKIKPVQCHGLRNGEIEITQVKGLYPPFYFSIDGLTYSTRPVFDLLRPGKHMVYVRDSTGCVKKFPALVSEPEELKVKIVMQDTLVVAGEWVQFSTTVYPKGSAISSIRWTPEDVFTQQSQNQIVKMSTDAEVGVEFINTSQCVATDRLFVKVQKTNLYFPNAFSPGSPQNNYFTVFAGDGVARVLQLEVFGRDGQLVYEARNFAPNDPDYGWNGKIRGRFAQPGVYAWVASVLFLDGKQQQYSGAVTLVN